MQKILLIFLLVGAMTVSAQQRQKRDSLSRPKPVTSIDKAQKGTDTITSKDVAINLLDEAPIYPGCKGNAKELRKCLNRSIQRHIAMKFDGGLFNSLGLPSGKKRIIMLFRIDENGVVSDIKVKAPHPKLEEESKRVLRLLPKFMPGMYQGKPVGVRYTLPFRFQVAGKTK